VVGLEDRHNRADASADLVDRMHRIAQLSWFDLISITFDLV
jgi:hypothetical protein